MNRRQELEAAIRKHREAMRIREMGHELYFSDPHGRAQDLKLLHDLQDELRKETERK